MEGGRQPHPLTKQGSNYENHQSNHNLIQMA